MSSSAFTRLSELHAQLSAVYAELAQQQAPAAREERSDALIRIREACRRKGWTYSWGAKHWRELGGFKDADGGLKIRADVLARHGPGISPWAG